MMLKPTKHSHPDRTIINIALLMLVRLKKNRFDDYDTLRKFAKQTVNGGDVLFLPALNFLFILGLVEYRAKNDIVEYIGPNENL